MEIGAFLSLAVTVAGGVVVYYFSQWNEKQAGERLVYKVEKASVFEDNTQSLSIQQVYLANEGGDQSQNVKLVVGFGEDTLIDDYRVDFLSMVPSDHSINPQSENKIEVAVESLTAGETVRVSLLLSGEPPASNYICKEFGYDRAGDRLCARIS